jgi:hypothetical protein
MEARTVGKSSAVAFDAPGELNNVAVARTREFVITCLAVGIYLDVFPASQKMQASPTPSAIIPDGLKDLCCIAM